MFGLDNNTFDVNIDKNVQWYCYDDGIQKP